MAQKQDTEQDSQLSVIESQSIHDSGVEWTATQVNDLKITLAKKKSQLHTQRTEVRTIDASIRRANARIEAYDDKMANAQNIEFSSKNEAKIIKLRTQNEEDKQTVADQTVKKEQGQADNKLLVEEVDKIIDLIKAATQSPKFYATPRFYVRKRDVTIAGLHDVPLSFIAKKTTQQLTPIFAVGINDIKPAFKSQIVNGGDYMDLIQLNTIKDNSQLTVKTISNDVEFGWIQDMDTLKTFPKMFAMFRAELDREFELYKAELANASIRRLKKNISDLKGCDIEVELNSRATEQLKSITKK